MPEFEGLKLSADRRVQKRPWGVRHVKTMTGTRTLQLKRLGEIGWAGNSGFQCINLAVQFGAVKILLVGFDMTTAHGVHWHGPHQGLRNPDEAATTRWRAAVDKAAETLEALGVRTINCSAISALQNYPKMTVQEALEC